MNWFWSSGSSNIGCSAEAFDGHGSWMNPIWSVLAEVTISMNDKIEWLLPAGTFMGVRLALDKAGSERPASGFGVW